TNLQLDVPNPLIPGRFYIANAGDATSKGVETEVSARVYRGWSLFSAIAYDDASFNSGSSALGQNVGGNKLPYAPQTTWNVGAEVIEDLGASLTFYGRAEAFGYGRFFYDATNAQSQSRYVIADFRIGIEGGAPLPVRWRLDGWIRNAFDEEYVPLA